MASQLDLSFLVGIKGSEKAQKNHLFLCAVDTCLVNSPPEQDDTNTSVVVVSPCEGSLLH